MIDKKLKFNSTLTALNPTAVQYIVIHHIEANFAKVEDIHAWHIGNGWAGIGYNEYIRKNGEIYKGRGDCVGAHTQGYNSISYGVALEGDFEKEQISQTQYNALLSELKLLKAKYPNAKIVGHNKLNNTACPGKNIDVFKINNDINTDNEFINAVWALKSKGIISSPDYWLENAQKGKTCLGEYVAQLIKNIAKI